MGKGPQARAGVSQGVDALVERLRAEGVEAGERAAQEIRAAAEAEAQAILAAARQEAEALRAQARRDAQADRSAGAEALRAAAREAILRLRQDLIERFNQDMRRRVSEAVAEPALLRAMILEVAAGAREAAGVRAGEPIFAHASAADAYEALRADMDGLRSAGATQLVLAVAGGALGQGLTLVQAQGAGLTLRLRDGDLEIDLSDAALADVLSAQLQPHLRAVFDGVIR